MKIKPSILSVCVSTCLVSSVVLADTQTITPSKTSFQATAGDMVEFDVNYSSSSPNQTTGLGLKLNYDSSKLSLVDISEVFTTGKVAQATGANKKNTGKGINIEADKTFNVAWASLGGDWPGSEGSDTKLLKVKFKVNQGFTSSTTINFNGEASAGNTFSATPVTITPVEKTIASTDGEISTSGGGSAPWLLSFMLLLGVMKKGLFRKIKSKLSFNFN